MGNRVVALVIIAKTTDKGWRRYAAVIGKNGQIRPGYGMVGGESVSFEQYRYELRRYEGRKQVYEQVGTDAAKAYAAQKREQRQVTVRQDAKAAGVRVVQETSDRPIDVDIDRFLQRTKDAGSLEAAQTYGVALADFMAAARISRADQIDEDVMLRFHAELRRKGNGDRTVANKHAAVKAFILWLKMDPKLLGRAPRYEKKLPKVYSTDQISSLIGENAAQAQGKGRTGNDSDVMAVTLDVLRMAGLREQEAIFLQWPDIELASGVIKVRSKPKLGFKIKDKEQRDVAIPAELVRVLKAWKRKRPDAKFVLGTEGDRPNYKMLRSLKRLARRAGLNCGRCDGCQADHQECREFTLHSFRRSYATELSKRGIPVRTIMQQLGHSDLETVLKYLAGMQVGETKSLLDQQPW
jgi:integrase